MSIRFPTQILLDQTMVTSSGIDNTGTIILPQDTDNVTVLTWAPTLGATTDDIYFQTSPDGGTTWYDMGNVQHTATSVQQNARIAMFSTSGAIDRSNQATNSAIGAAAASTIGANLYAGVPIMGQAFRVSHKIGGSGSNSIRVQVLCNNQSSRS